MNAHLSRSSSCILAASLVAATVALGACSGNAKEPTKSVAAPSRGTSPEPATSSATAKAIPGSLKDAKGAVDALGDFECKASDKTWSATGTLTNKGKASQTYQVRVAVVKPKSFEVLATKQQVADVKPGKTIDFTMDKIYTGSEKGLLCIPTVVTGTK